MEYMDQRGCDSDSECVNTSTSCCDHTGESTQTKEEGVGEWETGKGEKEMVMEGADTPRVCWSADGSTHSC